MPIRSLTIQKYGKPFILVDESTTLAEAIGILKIRELQPNQTYLIVKSIGGKFRVAPFLEFVTIIELLGPECLDSFLSKLPVPSADRVVDVNIPGSAQVILDWTISNPNSTVVILDDKEVVGLFTQSRRSGLNLFPGIDLLELGGQIVDLSKDPRSKFKANVKPPKCPNCGYKDFYDFDTNRGVFFCRNCKQLVARTI